MSFSFRRLLKGSKRTVWLLGTLLAVVVILSSREEKAVATISPDAVDFYVEPHTASESTEGAARRVRRQFAALQAKAEQARDEVNRWIMETPALDPQLAGKFNNELSLRMEHRTRMISREYREFRHEYPNFVPAKYAQEAFVADMNDRVTAVKGWEQGRRQDQHNPEGWMDLAHFFGHKGPITNVFVCYEKALTLDDGSSENYQNLATAIFLFRSDAQEYFKLQNEQQVYDRALELYEQALAADSGSFALACDIAQSYYVIKPTRAEDALGAWKRALRLASNDSEREQVYLHLARFEIHAGRPDAARGYLDKVSDSAGSDQKEAILRRVAPKNPDSSDATPSAPRTKT